MAAAGGRRRAIHRAGAASALSGRGGQAGEKTSSGSVQRRQCRDGLQARVELCGPVLGQCKAEARAAQRREHDMVSPVSGLRGCLPWKFCRRACSGSTAVAAAAASPTEEAVGGLQRGEIGMPSQFDGAVSVFRPQCTADGRSCARRCPVAGEWPERLQTQPGRTQRDPGTCRAELCRRRCV